LKIHLASIATTNFATYTQDNAQCANIVQTAVKKYTAVNVLKGNKKMYNVLVTSRELPGNALRELKTKCNVTLLKTQPSKIQLLKLIADKDAVLGFERIDADVIAAGKKLKVISNNAVGFDNIDIATATKHGIIVTNTPGVLSQTVAEHAFALLMAVAHRIVEGDYLMRRSKYHGGRSVLSLGTELKGKTLGIVGLGRIGSVVAKIAMHGYGMKVVYYSEHRNKKAEQSGIQYLSFKQLLAQSDFISLHVPLTDKTRHLIGAKQLKQMKRSAFLINTSRGPVIDEKALVTALKHKTIAGAGLDVFEFEPKLSLGLSKLFNVVLTPHIGSATIEARTAMADLAIDNLWRALNGKKPKAIVNPEVLK